MNSKILIIVAILFVVTGSTARQCYQCLVCPKPFNGNEQGVAKIEVGDNDYCMKTVIGNTETRSNGGSSCTPIGTSVFCCKGNLCNGATTVTLNIKFLAAMVSVLFAVQFFH